MELFNYEKNLLLLVLLRSLRFLPIVPNSLPQRIRKRSLSKWMNFSLRTPGLRKSRLENASLCPRLECTASHAGEQKTLSGEHLRLLPSTRLSRKKEAPTSNYFKLTA